MYKRRTSESTLTGELIYATNSKATNVLTSLHFINTHKKSS